MATKVKQDSYHVSFDLKMKIGFDIQASNMIEAVEKAQAMKINDIVAFEENGWDHEDSDQPVLTAVWHG